MKVPRRKCPRKLLRKGGERGETRVRCASNILDRLTVGSPGGHGGWRAEFIGNKMGSRSPEAKGEHCFGLLRRESRGNKSKGGGDFRVDSPSAARSKRGSFSTEKGK